MHQWKTNGISSCQRRHELLNNASMKNRWYIIMPKTRCLLISQNQTKLDKHIYWLEGDNKKGHNYHSYMRRECKTFAWDCKLTADKAWKMVSLRQLSRRIIGSVLSEKMQCICVSFKSHKHSVNSKLQEERHNYLWVHERAIYFFYCKTISSAVKEDLEDLWRYKYLLPKNSRLES